MNRVKTILTAGMSALLLAGAATQAHAQGSGGAEGGGRAVAGQAPRVYVNGNPVDGDLSPTSINGTLYVPLRFMTEYIGGKADWNNARQQATLTLDTRTLVLTAGSARATLNGEGRAMRHPVVVTKGRTLIPAQDVARFFNAQTRYNPDSRVLFITTPGGSLTPTNRNITRNTQRSNAAGQGVGVNGQPLRGNGKGQTANTARQGTSSVVTRPNGKGGRASGVAPSVRPANGSGDGTTGTGTITAP